MRAVLGQTVDEEKKLQFLKAREEMKTLPMTPSPESSPKPKPKPKPAHPAPTPAPTPEPATPRPRQKPEPEPEATPKPRPKPTPEANPRPPAATPRPSTPPPAKSPLPPRQPAPLVIEKSGFEEQHGYQTAPAAGWFEHWKYLTNSVRAEIDHAPVLARRWRYIIVHNSGTRQGNAKAFDYYHRFVRRMPNGLAYHFVIGNGTSSGDGEIEIGNRWRRQINGGHVHSDYLNSIALGICLVRRFQPGSTDQTPARVHGRANSLSSQACR